MIISFCFGEPGITFNALVVNFNISIKRANAVAQALINSGVPAEKLIIDAVGASEPISSEAMPNGERANRRAEISLSAA